MRKSLKNIGLIIIAGLLSFSCEEELEVNKNLNAPTNVDAALFLTAAEASLVSVIGGELTNYGGFMAQYHTQAPGASQYDDIDNYNVVSSYADRIWQEAYAGGINDLDKVIELSEGNTGNLLIARLLRVYYFQVLTDFFGDIPFSLEALPGLSNLNLEVVSQQEIYSNLISEVRNAVKTYEENPVASSFENQDVLLGGDADKWVLFANTLLLKMNLRLSETSAVNPQAIIDLLNENKFLEENVAFDIFTGKANRSNPFYEVQLNELGGINHVASNSLFEFLYQNDDVRIDAIYINTGAIGLEQGGKDTNTDLTAGDFAVPNIEPKRAVFLFTKAEVNFLLAEALVRYQGGAGAQEKYETGILESFLLFNSFGELEPEERELLKMQAQENAQAAIEGVYAFNQASSNQEKIEQIIVQKWVANAYVNTIESYFDQLRTGYPQLVSREEIPEYALGRLRVSQSSVFISDTAVPLSMFYSQQEVNTNRNLEQKSSLVEPVWWDQN